MAQQGSQHEPQVVSGVRAQSPVIDLEECISQEMARQAGLQPNSPKLPFLKTELLLHQKKNLRRMIDLEAGGRSILMMDVIGMGKTLQTLCLVLSSLTHDQWAQSPSPGSLLPYYRAAANPAARTKWEDARTSVRYQERQVKVFLSRVTLVVVQKANLGHWANEIQKHLELPTGFVVVHDTENPMTASELVNSDCRIVLVSREAITSLYIDAIEGQDVWLFGMRFLRLVLDEGGASTGKKETTRHALMIQAIHADSKVLVDATPYEQGTSRKAKQRKLRELGATRSFFAGTRSFEELQRQWERKVVRAAEGREVATMVVQQFLADHLVRSQPADRPHIPPAEHDDVPLRFNDSQAFAYNRLLAAQQFAFLTYYDALLANNLVRQYLFRLTDCVMDTYSYDLVCNPERERLLKDFNLASLMCSPAFANGMADVRKAEATWGAFTSALFTAGVPPERLSAITKLLVLHGVNTPDDAASRECSRCREDSFVPIIAPVCGHVICTRCLFTQKHVQQPGSSGAQVFKKEQWCKKALKGLQFECGYGHTFSQRELAQHPGIHIIPHGLCLRGSPKVAWILRFVREHPQEKTLIYLTDKRHRDTVANYFHAQGVPLADFSRRGANERPKDRDELVRLIEGFKLPVGAVPRKGDPPPVFLGLAAGTSASTGVRGLDLHVLQHIIVIGHIGQIALEQLLGRGLRIGQRGRLQVWFLYIEGSVEDKQVHDQLGDKRDRLLSLKPLEGTGEPEDEATFEEAFPLNSVVWLRKGAGRVPAQVRPSPHTYMRFGQRGKVYVILFNKIKGKIKGVWAAVADLSMFHEDEESLQNLDPATLSAIGQEPNCSRILREALAEAQRVGQVRAPGDREPGPAAGVDGRGNEPGAQNVIGGEPARSRGVNADVGVVTPGGVNTGTEVLTRDEAERRRKGKRKADVSLDDEIETEEEEGPALIRRGKRLKDTPRRERSGDPPGAGADADAGHVAGWGPREGGVISSVARSLRMEAAIPVPGTFRAVRSQLPNLRGGSFSPTIDTPNGGLPTERDPLRTEGVGDSDEEDGFGSGRIVARGKKRSRSRIVSDGEGEEDGVTVERTPFGAEEPARQPGTSEAGREAAEERRTNNGLVRNAPTACVQKALTRLFAAPGDAAPPTCRNTPPAGSGVKSAVRSVEVRGSPGQSPDHDASRKGTPSASDPGLETQPKAEPFAPISPLPRVWPTAGTGRNREQREQTREALQAGGVVNRSLDPSAPVAPREEGPGHEETPHVSGLVREEVPRGSNPRHEATVPVGGLGLAEAVHVNGSAHEEAPRGNGPVDIQNQEDNADGDLARYGEEGLELRARLQEALVPAPAIESLLEADFTMDHLRLGLLALQELRQLVAAGLLPAAHFKLGTLALLDRASKMHANA